MPDWFGSLTGTGVYYLRDGMDRWDGSYQNVNNPAVFGFAVPVDNSKLLNGIDIVITDLPGGVTFAMLGATATVESSTAVNSAPFVSTTSPSAVGPFAASSGGNVFDGGSTAVTARGVAYGTSPSPSLGGASVASGSGTGSFSSSLTGLLPATTYFLRAFATNSVGTGYGEEVSFTTLRAPTTTSITGTSVGASSQTNQAVTVDVGVAGFDPSGTVTVRARRADNAIVASCVATLGAATSGSASGSCTLAAGSLKAGAGITHLSASYAGDTNDDSSVSGNFGFAVARGGVTISSVVVDTSGDRNAVSGEPITVTVSLAAVAPAVGPVTGDGTGAPDLTISTSEAGTGCSIDWDVATECTLVFTGVNNTSQLLAAVNDPDPKRAAVAKATLAKTLQVSFAETDDFNGAGPTAADGVNVSSAPTTTVLSTRALSGPVNSVAGEGVRLTATVTTDAPSTIPPRGRVLFTRDATVLGQVTLTAGPGNTATAEFVAPARPVGTETYFAFFLNNDDFIGSDDDAEHSTVKAATSTTISSVLPASPQALQTVTVSASVAAVAPGAGTPTGTITIAGTDTTGCVITLPATSCELSFASQGSKTLTATYGGDSQFLASGASSDTETVTVVGIPVT
ncbi:MAG: Ig-like domain repeat protein, partial [Lysobacterales bacterium]